MICRIISPWHMLYINVNNFRKSITQRDWNSTSGQISGKYVTSLTLCFIFKIWMLRMKKNRNTRDIEIESFSSMILRRYLKKFLSLFQRLIYIIYKFVITSYILIHWITSEGHTRLKTHIIFITILNISSTRSIYKIAETNICSSFAVIRSHAIVIFGQHNLHFDQKMQI